MEIAVSMHLVVFGLIASLALLCAVIHAGLRKQSALLWLAAALVCAGVETMALSAGRQSQLAVAAVSLLVPGAYLCLSQSIRTLLALPNSSRMLVGTVGALTTLSLVLLADGAHYFYQQLPFQVGGALALGDSILCLCRIRHKSVLDKCLLAVLGCMAVVVAVRIPLFPILFDGTTPYGEIQRSTLQRALLGAAMVTAPTSVLLIVAKIVTGVIAGHRERSERDYLTNLPNRRSFERLSSTTAETGGAVIVCDIDHFKTINDRYGHAVGDDIIRVFASLLHGSAARVGGEEFALLLPGANVAEATVLADAIRAKFHALRHPALDRNHRLSASFGVAGFRPGDAAHTALVRADTALYLAKEEGRNRVSVHGDTTTQAATGLQQVA